MNWRAFGVVFLLLLICACVEVSFSFWAWLKTGALSWSEGPMIIGVQVVQLVVALFGMIWLGWSSEEGAE